MDALPIAKACGGLSGEETSYVLPYLWRKGRKAVGVFERLRAHSQFNRAGWIKLSKLRQKNVLEI